MIFTPHRGERCKKASVSSPFFVIALLVSSVVFAQDKQRTANYEVTWGGKTVATMKLSQTCANHGQIGLQLKAKSTGLVDQFHAFDARFRSVVRDDLKRTDRSESYIVEDGEPRKFVSKLGPKGMRTWKTFRNKETQTLTLVPNNTQDFVSWLFALRIKKLEPGNTFSFFTWDGWKLTKIDADVMKPGAVYLPAVDSAVDAIRVKVYRTVVSIEDPNASVREREKLGIIYFNKSDQMPIAMDYSAPIADAKIRMISSAQKGCH